MLTSDLCLWVILGVLAAGVMGFVMQRIRWSRNRMRAFFEPQTITLSTGRSPAQLFVGCLQGALTLVFVLVLIGLLIYLASYWY